MTLHHIDLTGIPRDLQTRVRVTLLTVRARTGLAHSDAVDVVTVDSVDAAVRDGWTTTQAMSLGLIIPTLALADCADVWTYDPATQDLRRMP